MSMTPQERMQVHYNEAVDCLNGVARGDTSTGAQLTAAPLLIQTAIAHALLGLLCATGQDADRLSRCSCR